MNVFNIAKANKLIILSLYVFNVCSMEHSSQQSVYEKIVPIISALAQYKSIFTTEQNQVASSGLEALKEKKYAKFVSAGLTFGVDGLKSNLRYLLSIKNILIAQKPENIFLLGAGKGSAAIALLIDVILKEYPQNKKVILYYNDIIDENFLIFKHKIEQAFGNSVFDKISIVKCIGDAFDDDFIKKFIMNYGRPDQLIEERVLHFTLEKKIHQGYMPAAEKEFQLCEKKIENFSISQKEQFQLNKKQILNDYKQYKDKYVSQKCFCNILNFQAPRVSLYSNNIYLLPNSNYSASSNNDITVPDSTVLEGLKSKWNKLRNNNQLTKENCLIALNDLIKEKGYYLLTGRTYLLPKDLFDVNSVSSLVKNGYKNVRMQIFLNHDNDETTYSPAFYKDVFIGNEDKEAALLNALVGEHPWHIIFKSFHSPQEMQAFLNDILQKRYLAGISYQIQK